MAGIVARLAHGRLRASCERYNVRRTHGDGPPSTVARWSGGALPDFADLDLKVLSRQSSHPVLGAVATSLLPRMLRGESAMAFYEDGPYQL